VAVPGSHFERSDHASSSSGLTHEPQAKAKYNAWRAKVDDGISVEEAQEKYVAKIEEMKTKYGYDENKEPEAVGGQ
jgi:diazepam-binding inhibitor (GABA receptor modulating acyl-CoA-binding protein)